MTSAPNTTDQTPSKRMLISRRSTRSSRQRSSPSTAGSRRRSIPASTRRSDSAPSSGAEHLRDRRRRSQDEPLSAYPGRRDSNHLDDPPSDALRCRPGRATRRRTSAGAYDCPHKRLRTMPNTASLAIHARGSCAMERVTSQTFWIRAEAGRLPSTTIDERPCRADSLACDQRLGSLQATSDVADSS